MMVSRFLRLAKSRFTAYEPQPDKEVDVYAWRDVPTGETKQVKTGTKQVKTGTRTEDVGAWKNKLVKVETWQWQRVHAKTGTRTVDMFETVDVYKTVDVTERRYVKVDTKMVPQPKHHRRG